MHSDPVIPFAGLTRPNYRHDSRFYRADEHTDAAARIGREMAHERLWAGVYYRTQAQLKQREVRNTG